MKKSKAWSISRRMLTAPSRAWRTTAIRLCGHHQQRDDYRKPLGTAWPDGIVATMRMPRPATVVATTKGDHDQEDAQKILWT